MTKLRVLVALMFIGFILIGLAKKLYEAYGHVSILKIGAIVIVFFVILFLVLNSLRSDVNKVKDNNAAKRKRKEESNNNVVN